MEELEHKTGVGKYKKEDLASHQGFTLLMP